MLNGLCPPGVPQHLAFLQIMQLPSQKITPIYTSISKVGWGPPLHTLPKLGRTFTLTPAF